MATPRLVQLIDRYRSAHGVSEAEVARRIGVSRENLRKWRTNGVSRLPGRTNLAAVARIIGRPYREVLSAALFDTGYLTDDQARVPRPYDEVLHDAINVLTEATRLTNQLARRTESGQWEPDLDPRATVPIDWAEFVTLALAGAAANAGGIETALAGRPGSWEAERVRQTLQSTVLDDKDLLRHRTEPVVVDLWVESILNGLLDDPTDDNYNNAEIELDNRANAIPQPDDLPPGPFSPDDPRIAAADWVDIDENGYLVITYAGWTGDPPGVALLTELQAEAEAYRGPTPGEIAYNQALEQISALVDALNEQWRRDYADYAQRLIAAIENNLRELNLPVPISVTVASAPSGASSEDFDTHRPPDYPTNPIEAAVEAAIMHTPTPSAVADGRPLERVEAARRHD